MMEVVRRRSSRSRMRMEMKNEGAEEDDDAMFGWKKISNIAAMMHTHRGQGSQKTKDRLLSCNVIWWVFGKLGG